jgi:hypothetical protein
MPLLREEGGQWPEQHPEGQPEAEVVARTPHDNSDGCSSSHPGGYQQSDHQYLGGIQLPTLSMLLLTESSDMR